MHSSSKRVLAAAAVLVTAMGLAACDSKKATTPEPQAATSGTNNAAELPSVQGSVSPTTPMEPNATASAPRSGIDGRNEGSGQQGIAAGSRGETVPGSGTAGGLAPSNPPTPTK